MCRNPAHRTLSNFGRLAFLLGFVHCSVLSRFGACGNTGEQIELLKDHAHFLANTGGIVQIARDFGTVHPDEAVIVFLQAVDTAIIVDLPDPEGPHITTRSPCITCKLTPLSA